jgi:adenine phosphoribosyltransferase
MQLRCEPARYKRVRVRDLKELIRDIPDFPKPGILFRDITPLLLDAPAFRETVERICAPFLKRVDVVVGIESRGFIVGAAVAYHLGTGLALVRKPGKLPAATFEARYDLEYGSDGLQIHQDAFRHGSRVLVVDDLLATGGTASATVELVRRTGGEVIACAFVIELAALGGRKRLAPADVRSLIQY